MAASAAMRPASAWRFSNTQRTRPIIAPGIMAPSEPPPIEPRSPQPSDMAIAPRAHQYQAWRVAVIDERSGESRVIRPCAHRGDVGFHLRHQLLESRLTPE